MRAVIRYFSGTGNTRYGAELFAERLKGMGYSVSCESIETAGPILEEMDLLVIGGPVMAGNVPEQLIRWVLRSVPSVSRGDALVFTTSAGLENAHGVHSLARKLAKKGFRVVGQPVFEMPRNYYFGRYEPTPAEDQRRLAAELPGKVAGALADIGNGSPPVPLQGKGKTLTQDLTAELFGLIARGMGKKFTSFPGDCIGCGRCIRECPRQNIRANPAGGVVFQGRCMLCTRCIHHCPAHAIGYGGVKYARYSGPPGREPEKVRRSN